jgi:hypothetical protein
MIDFVFLGIIALVLLAPFPLSLRRIPDEKGLPPIYKDRAMIFERTLFLFFSGANIPYWRLAFYETFMVISAGLLPRMIRYDQIVKIEPKRLFISKGLYLEYLGGDRKHCIYIFPRNGKKVFELIKQKQ